MTLLRAQFYTYLVPVHPCRQMSTRHCPARYNDVCGERPCARFESGDPWPWVAEVIDWDDKSDVDASD